MKLTADYHVHSDISPDSSESRRNIAEAAVSRGISELMLTEHYEFYPEGVVSRYFDRAYLERYQKAYWELTESLSGRGDAPFVGFGVEFGQAYRNREAAKEILAAYEFDYVIGSCHKIDNIDLSQYDYEEATLRRLLDEYLSGLLAIAEDGMFDCLGHLDLIRRYAMRKGVDCPLSETDERVEEILRKAAERGKGIEINTSGIRQGVGEFLPAPAILKRFRELGGEIVTVGSDAHRACDIGADFDAAAEALLSAGFRYTAHYRKRRPSFVKIG